MKTTWLNVVSFVFWNCCEFVFVIVGSWLADLGRGLVHAYLDG